MEIERWVGGYGGRDVCVASAPWFAIVYVNCVTTSHIVRDSCKT